MQMSKNQSLISGKKGVKVLTKVILTAILAALAIGIGYIEIPLGAVFGAPWLKLDFSEVIILASFLLLGFKYSVGVIVLRSVVRWFISSNNTDIPFPGFGELIAVIASLVVVGAYILGSAITKDWDYKRTKRVSAWPYKRKRFNWLTADLVKIILVALMLTFVMTLINYLVMTPALASGGEEVFFTGFVEKTGMGYGPYTKMILSIYIPFNLIKGASCAIIFNVLKKPLISALNLN